MRELKSNRYPARAHATGGIQLEPARVPSSGKQTSVPRRFPLSVCSFGAVRCFFLSRLGKAMRPRGGNWSRPPNGRADEVFE